MKQFLVIAMAVLAAATFLLVPFGDAEAGRLGGGRSFGSKPFYSQPYRMNRPALNQTPSLGQAQNQARRTQLSQRGGLWGMLGGLALGGLLGALFFGGAFEGLKLFDILVFAGIALLLYYLFRMRRRARGMSAASPGDGAPGSGAFERNAYEDRSERGFDTDLLLKREGQGEAATVAPAPLSSIPEGFDRERFLEGAQSAYRRLQEAWDKGDLADIRQFTTDTVFTEIQDQFRARSGTNRTDVFKVDAQLLEAREVDDRTEASVLFDVLMREVDSEKGEDARPYQVREVWHFIRPNRSTRPTWFLDGIQQLEG
jgi:predicted lipid-binding transport protein (Tim44 family)